MTVPGSAEILLPPNPFQRNTDSWTAYEACLDLEIIAGWNVFPDRLPKFISEPIMAYLSPQIAARVLGQALLLAPTDGGHAFLMREINGCRRDPELLAGLAHLYVYGMIRVFYNPKGPTPFASTDESPAANAPSHLLTPATTTAHTLRNLTLIRDRKCCVFTGALDEAADESDFMSNPGNRMAVTNVARIISQSLSTGIGGMTPAALNKFQWASSPEAVLERFGDISTLEVLGNANLNSPSNVFTAEPLPHKWFNCLDLWLTPAKFPSTMSDTSKTMSGIMPQVTFRSVVVEGVTIPPPHPRLLALHAACAQIAHMSGAAENLLELFRDIDTIPDMTEPSAPSELARALTALQLASRHL